MNWNYRLLAAVIIFAGAAAGCTFAGIPGQQPSLTPSSAVPQASSQPPATATVLYHTPTLPPTESGENGSDPEESPMLEDNQMKITIGDMTLIATLADNSSAAALKEALSAGPITVNMRDYGSMEKVGSLGRELPRNDEQITTEAGDIILYQGNALVIYYAPNSWNFTRLGKINDVSAAELKEILGDGDVTVTLSLPQD